MWSCVEEASNVEHVFPFTLLDEAFFGYASDHWVEFDRASFVFVQFNWVFPKDPTKCLLVFGFRFLMSDSSVFPGFAIVERDLDLFDFIS